MKINYISVIRAVGMVLQQARSYFHAIQEKHSHTGHLKSFSGVRNDNIANCKGRTELESSCGSSVWHNHGYDAKSPAKVG